MIKKHFILTTMIGAMFSLLLSTYSFTAPIEGTTKPRPSNYTSPAAAKAVKVPSNEWTAGRKAGFLIVKSLKRPDPGFKVDFPRVPGFNEKYYEDWKAMLGFDSPSLVALNDPAPEIKPGTVITPANFQTFPNLPKIMPESQYWRLSSKGYPQIKKIEVQATRPIYHHTLVMQQSLKNSGKVKVDPQTYQLTGGYKAGIPFLNPKSGLEADWNSTMARVFYIDQFSFQTINFLNFDGRGNLERTIRCNLYWMRFSTRTCMNYDEDFFLKGAAKDKQDGVLEKGAMVAIFPTDIKGFAFVRTRFMAPDRPDYFIAFVPGMRRVRVLSGTDAQDPIFGSELQWDTWASDWKKISANIYPDSHNLLGEAIILYPGYQPTPTIRVEGNMMYAKWEKRPVRVLEVISKDPRYYYGYRVKCLDMEHNRETNHEYYDTKGNLWRGWTGFGYTDPKTSYSAWDGADCFDYINRHHTILKVQSRPNDPTVNPSYFDLRFLSRQAR